MKRLSCADGEKLGRLFVQCRSESDGRFLHSFNAEAERPMVYRYEITGTSLAGHVYGFLGTAMGLDPRIVRPNGHEHKIDRMKWIVELCKGGGVRGVPGKANRVSFSFHEVAIVATMGIAHHTCSPVSNLDCRKPDWAVTRGNNLMHTPIELVNVAKAMTVEEVCRRACRDDGCLSVEFSQTPDVEMIKMGVT